MTKKTDKKISQNIRLSALPMKSFGSIRIKTDSKKEFEWLRLKIELAQ